MLIQQADDRSFDEFVIEYERLVAAARRGRLKLPEIQGASITLTNPGGVGTVASVPRLMPDQGCIVAVGAIGYSADWRDAEQEELDALGVAKIVTLTNTYDHRIIQGAQSGEFLARIDALLQGSDDFYGDIFASLSVEPISLAGPPKTAPKAAPGDAARMIAAAQSAAALVQAFRTHGHLGAHLDPLGNPPSGDPSLDPKTHGLDESLMRQIPTKWLDVDLPGETMADVFKSLQETYCGSTAYEIEHIANHGQRTWLRDEIETGNYLWPLDPAAKQQLLRQLINAESLEAFLHRAFLGQKSYSGEGIESQIPMLRFLLELAATDAVEEVVIGMAHRGRLGVITEVVQKPYESILAAFEHDQAIPPEGTGEGDPTGDVKYHSGAVATYTSEQGREVVVRLLPNPSHLEAIDAVVEGWVRAKQTLPTIGVARLERRKALPVLIHGDAAFTGQGVVAEVFNLQSLRGYSTGGTLHLIANNQIGFTTEPQDARSTRYASDLAKGFDVPIIHVNGDDIEACIQAIALAHKYLRTFERDVLIDLIGYRRLGHNETDEPGFTQPLMYREIRSHPTVSEIYAQRLVAENVISSEEVERYRTHARDVLAAAHRLVQTQLLDGDASEDEEADVAAPPTSTITAVDHDTLTSLGDEIFSVPESFHLNSKLAQQWLRHRQSLGSGGIDWGTAEALALASLLEDGRRIRLTGQDTERGTFSQRHLVLHDDRDGSTYTPMQHLKRGSASFEVFNSPLSEFATLAFEYGYSAADPDTLVLWEAQYGDFVNNAQMVVDQFIASAAPKWQQSSRLTLLLPHGYEGQGPEHSSARVERYLELSAHNNIRVANCSTAAQYFHLLRQQALFPEPQPLVLLTPKSLLRLPAASASLAQLSRGGFAPVLDDDWDELVPGEVTTVLLCSGKVYYDLTSHPGRKGATDIVVVRMELLEPIPLEPLAMVLQRYPGLERLVWVQEEPANMGAWSHVVEPLRDKFPDFDIEYVGRPRRATPSEGHLGTHRREQQRIVSAALAKARSRV